MRVAKAALIFYGMGGGTRKAVKKHAGGMFLGRGRVPGLPDASGTDVDGDPFP